MTIPHRCLRAWRRVWLSAQRVQIGPRGDIGRGVVARVRQGQISIGADCSVETGVVLDTYGGSIALGHHVFLGPYTVIYGHGGVVIGDETLISMHCRILSSNHAVPPMGSAIRAEPDILRPTKIGHDVWLGAGVTVLGGVAVGDGCVVGAGAVITHDLPPGSIAYGVPATVRAQRPWRDSQTKPTH